ncbi:MAG: AAA domain-containing protein [Candidatus Azobacteroides sp.]|nr:AAA domain-containing protein [Candidatus Azobacteroides sp.]
MNTGNYQIIVKGKDKTKEIISFEPNGNRFDIKYLSGDKTYSYLAKDVKIIKSALLDNAAKNIFDYLKEIAQEVGLKDEKGGNILSNRYAKIDFVSENSMLSAFLTGHLKSENNKESRIPIYPFGFNASQKDAVNKALNHSLSIIEGPPGTGKTQIILNIIANAVMYGESVAVVSSNNSATKNVLEKLEKNKADFIAAYLGSSQNKTDFINSQKSLPDFTEWKLEEENKQRITKTLQTLFSYLNTMLSKKNYLSSLKRELSSFELEYRYFKQYYDTLNISIFDKSLKINNPDKILELWLLCENFGSFNQLQKWIKLLTVRFKYGSQCKALFLHSLEILIALCQKQYYEKKIEEINKSIKYIENELNKFDFNRKMNEYSELSMKIFHDKLAKKYSTKDRIKFTIDDLWKNSEDFIEEYSVVLSTTYSLRSSLSNKTMYDYVIIDEASQVDIATGALALSCAEKAVIVGDLKQLPNVVTDETARETDRIFLKYNIPEVYLYSSYNLLLSLTKIFPDAPKTMLCEHYRCHPKIIEFCNQKFYNNRLIVLTEPKSNSKPLILYKTAEGNHARNRVNQRQIDVIKNEIIPQQKLNTENGSVGIVTPYRNQTNALQEAFKNTHIKADTVDKFQGQENDVIILSTVDNEISNFTDNANRLNVAVSRAINQLIVVVNGNDIKRDTNIGDLVRYIEYNNFEIIQSEIYSVFDFLYKNYAEKRNQLLKNKKRISKFDSENLMYHEVILKVLQDEPFNQFDAVVHFPLRMILNNTKKLNNEEVKYALNALTHIDFLIFDKIGKAPRLAIEVDGGTHEQEKQKKRDEMKDAILEKYNIPIIRFKTNESGEKEKLIQKLKLII